MKYNICDDKHNMYNLNINEIIHFIKQNPQETYFKYIDNQKIKINNNIVCNTQFICHRINTIDELNEINSQFGVEFDIRDDHKSGKLILEHEPFVSGECFENYLQKYKHNTMILNIKSERIEIECLKLLTKYNIHNYFFLDSSFPMIFLLNSKYKNNNIACRFSEFESLHFFLENTNRFSVIWVDCFTKFPLNTHIYQLIKQKNKKICIVSPELQGQPEKIEEYKNYIVNNNLIPNLICTKKHNIINWL